ncbi:MAG: peptidylprolyl isomerase [Lachnospiraceae bacterium]|nr:peptidylprolyl isomerase [Lachnospiraceae bacterium]
MKRIKELTVMLAVFCAVLVLAAGCGAKKDEKAQSEAQKQEETQEKTEAQDAGEGQKETEAQSTGEDQKETEAQDAGESLKGPQVEIKVKDYGTIKLTLDKTNAPITVDNFVKLAEEGFYDGLTFHRIIDGFMIQGGDPLGNGTGGSDETIKGEFSENGVDNKISHKRGVISMARSQMPDSASSQFFIVQADSTYLDGQYAGFGYVTEGMEVVDEICKKVTVQDQNGTVSKEDQPVIESITVTE